MEIEGRKWKRHDVLEKKLESYFRAVCAGEVDPSLDEFQKRWDAPPDARPLISAVWHSLWRDESLARVAKLPPRADSTDIWANYPGAHFFFELPPANDEARVTRESLAAKGLPPLTCLTDLCEWMRVPALRLAWLADPPRRTRPPSKALNSYRYVLAPKRTGGRLRVLEVPKEQLKAVQRKIDQELLAKLPVHPAAFGFVSGRDTRGNAEPHVGKDWVWKLDLADFFTTERV